MRYLTEGEIQDTLEVSLKELEHKGAKYPFTGAMVRKLLELLLEPGELYLDTLSGMTFAFGEPVQKYHATKIARHLLDCRISINDSPVRAAMELYAKDHSKNVAIEYIKSIKWDGKKRLDSWLSELTDSPITENMQRLSRVWALQCANIWTRPGEKAKMVILFEGAEGAGKTPISLAMAFNQQRWHVDNLKDLSNDKEVGRKLSGILVCELAELKSLKRADVMDHFKQVVGTQADVFDHKYQNRDYHLRSTVFVGTTNESQYLNDTTGNTRIFPVKFSRMLTAEEVESFAESWKQIVAEALIEVNAWRADKNYAPGRPYMLAEENLQYAQERDSRMVYGDELYKLSMWLKRTGRDKLGMLIPSCEVNDFLWGEGKSAWASGRTRYLMEKLQCRYTQVGKLRTRSYKITQECLDILQEVTLDEMPDSRITN